MPTQSHTISLWLGGRVGRIKRYPVSLYNIYIYNEIPNTMAWKLFPLKDGSGIYYVQFWGSIFCYVYTPQVGGMIEIRNTTCDDKQELLRLTSLHECFHQFPNLQYLSGIVRVSGMLPLRVLWQRQVRNRKSSYYFPWYWLSNRDS